MKNKLPHNKNKVTRLSLTKDGVNKQEDPTTNTNNSGFARDGIDTQNHGTTLAQGLSGGGQMAQGTGSVGAHTHSVTYTLNRTHNHSINGQQGDIQMSGFDSKIEPKHMPIVYIIYTGVN